MRAQNVARGFALVSLQITIVNLTLKHYIVFVFSLLLLCLLFSSMFRVETRARKFTKTRPRYHPSTGNRTHTYVVDT